VRKVRFRIKAIEDNVPFRPEGYLEEVISSGEVRGQYLVMDETTALRLVEKYTEPNPVMEFSKDPKQWGPRLWKILHDRTRQESFDASVEKRWLQIFHRWIPCGQCSMHWRKVLKELPPNLSSTKAYEEWAIDAHNIVNRDLGKPVFRP
jgi:hypothetical protein